MRISSRPGSRRPARSATDDPLVAFDDAYRIFGPDEAIISTHTPEHSGWLEQGVVEKARERFEVPITHVVVESVTA